MGRAPDCLTVMHASRFQTPLFLCGVFREISLFRPSRCDQANTLMAVELRLRPVYRR